MPDEPYPPLPPLPPREPWWRSLTKPTTLPRWAFVVIAVLMVVPPRKEVDLLPFFDVPTFPENHSIYIHDLDRTIDGRAAIREQCAASVDSVGKVGDYVTFNGEEFLRWSVTPKPGHVDQVWLSQRTGKVVCRSRADYAGAVRAPAGPRRSDPGVVALELANVAHINRTMASDQKTEPTPATTPSGPPTFDTSANQRLRSSHPNPERDVRRAEAEGEELLHALKACDRRETVVSVLVSFASVRGGPAPFVVSACTLKRIAPRGVV